MVNGEIYPLRSIAGHMSPDDFYHFSVPASEGDFRLHLVRDEGRRITNILYISVPDTPINFEEQLADARVIMEQYAGTDVECTLVIVTGEDLSNVKEPLDQAFTEMKMFLEPSNVNKFHLEIWDEDALRQKEQELGIRVDIPGIN